MSAKDFAEDGAEKEAYVKLTLVKLSPMYAYYSAVYGASRPVGVAPFCSPMKVSHLARA
jgi:hypothetical protein